MSNQLVETVNELKLLGWSEEGAKTYAELLDGDRFRFFSSNAYNLAIFLIIFLLFILIYSSTRWHLKRSIKSYEIAKETKDSQILLNDSKQIELNHLNTKSNEILLQKKKKKTELDESLKRYFRNNSIDLEKIADSIIAIGTFSYQIIKLSIKASSMGKGEKSVKKMDEKDILKSRLTKMNSVELRSYLKSVNIIPSLSREQLIDLIASNPSIIKKIQSKERQAILMKKTNTELRSLLSNVENVSRLKKVELVDKILDLESSV